MAKVRQDAWTEETDLLLAETVLRHIREGSTQLKAFEEVGDRLNRTSAACGFRWNAIVRDQYRDAIELAKKQRKERKRSQAARQPAPVYSDSSTTANTDNEGGHSSFNNLDGVIQYLQNLNRNNFSSEQLETENKRLQNEKEGLFQRNKDLEKKLSRLEREHELVKEDYQSLIQIMERARRMVVLQEEDSKNAPSFKMDKNGNLEKMAK